MEMYPSFQIMFAQEGCNNVNVRKSSNCKFRIKDASGQRQSAFWPEKMSEM